MARILIVEDETDLAELYRLILQDHGHTILGPYADPRDSLARPEEEPIDLILLDERLGRLSGSAYMDQFRKAFPSAKIALVSADPEAIEEGISRGADSVLKKPVHLSQLLEHVLALLADAPASG